MQKLSTSAPRVLHLGVYGILALAKQSRDIRNIESLRLASSPSSVMLAAGFVAEVLNPLTDRGLFRLTFENPLIEENLAPYLVSMFGNPVRLPFRMGQVSETATDR